MEFSFYGQIRVNTKLYLLPEFEWNIFSLAMQETLVTKRICSPIQAINCTKLCTNHRMKIKENTNFVYKFAMNVYVNSVRDLLLQRKKIGKIVTETRK